MKIDKVRCYGCGEMFEPYGPDWFCSDACHDAYPDAWPKNRWAPLPARAGAHPIPDEDVTAPTDPTPSGGLDTWE